MDASEQPKLPDNTNTPLPNRKKQWGMTRYPKSSKARTDLINTTLRDILEAVPLVDYKTDKGKQLIETYRANLNLMASGKIMYLRYLADPDSPMDDTAIKEQIKRCRASHDTFQQWETDRIFQFFYRIMRIGIMEMRIRVAALENIYFGVNQRDAETGIPTHTTAQREYTLATLGHFDWLKPTSQVTVNVGELPQPGELDKAEKEKLAELEKMAADNPEVAAIIESIQKGKLRANQTLAVGAGGEIKEVKNG